MVSTRSRFGPVVGVLDRFGPPPTAPAPEVVEEGVFRLGRLTLVSALAFAISLVAQTAIHLLGFPIPYDAALLAPRVVGIAASIALFAAVRSGRVRAERILRLALPYEVLGAVLIASTEAMVMSRMAGTVVGTSFVTLWIFLFRIFVPAPPRRAIAASLLSAAAVPVCHGAASVLGGAPFGKHLVVTSVMAFVFGGLAILVSRVMTRWQRQARRAQELGSYQLGEPIGSGGMGVVYRARHLMLKRDAAIKLIRSSDLGPADSDGASAALARFEREARATASLRSVHTIEVYDFGIADDGAFYYVMELLDGLDLDRLVADHGPVPPERAAHLLAQACHSLDDAHAHGLVHRDVKPANLFACRLGPDVDFVKVMDFGLVTGIPGAAIDPSRNLTLEGAICGTPAYMPPEMAEGTSTPDARSDIYSLGAVAFWLLTGRPVFVRDSAIATLIAHVHDEPPDPAELAPSLRDDFRRLILDCLAKDPAARPPTAREVRARLEALVFDAPWTAERAEAWWSEHRPPAGPDREGAAASTGRAVLSV